MNGAQLSPMLPQNLGSWTFFVEGQKIMIEDPPLKCVLSDMALFGWWMMELRTMSKVLQVKGSSEAFVVNVGCALIEK